jgi:hypothetical protein
LTAVITLTVDVSWSTPLEDLFPRGILSVQLGSHRLPNSRGSCVVWRPNVRYQTSNMHCNTILALEEPVLLHSIKNTTTRKGGHVPTRLRTQSSWKNWSLSSRNCDCLFI